MNTSTRINIVKLASGLRCKPGDLAIVGGRSFAENLGCIVEVLRPMGPVPGWEDVFIWEVRSTGRSQKTEGAIGDQIGFHEVCGTPDSCLTPITGLPLEESTEETDVRIAEQEMH